MEQDNILGSEKVSKLLLRFSVPAIIGMVVNAFYNIVDRIYIGNAPDLGANGLAGITIGFPIMIILLSVGNLFGVGGATLFSTRLGEGKNEEADAVLGNAFMASVISGLVLMVAGLLFLTPLLTIFGASGIVLEYAEKYMRVIFLGAVFQITSMTLNEFLRADGRPNLAMITMFAGAGTNIILDPIFIYKFHMGMAGAAWATILSQCLSMLWILRYFLSDRTKHRIRLSFMRPQLKVIRKITVYGLPIFLMQLGNSLLNAILNRTLLIYGGDIAISGMGVVNSVQTMLFMPITGLNQGVQPIVSFNYGARKYDRIKEVEKLAIAAATLIFLAGWIVTRLFPSQLVALFNRDPELIAFGSYALRVWFLCIPVVGFQILASNFFQAVGRPTVAMLLTLTRQILILIPAIIIFSRLWGLNGLLYAAPLSDGAAALLTSFFYVHAIKRLPVEDHVNKIS